MFTPEELRQAKIFACLDEAECARLAQTAADVRHEPGEWLAREDATAWFYALFEGRLRLMVDVHGKATQFPDRLGLNRPTGSLMCEYFCSRSPRVVPPQQERQKEHHASSNT
jgi:hypothetical protein